jgi:hypothetical protein
MDFAARRILPERFCGKCVLLKIEIFELEDARNDTEPIREICFAGGPGAGDIPDGPLGANATRARITPSRHTRDQTQRPIDLVVTVTLSSGKSETFSREIDIMEIVLLPDGRINMVHLVLVSGGERNTHIWYNYSGVSKFSYRYVTVEGKSKIRMRIIQPSGLNRGLTERFEPLGSKDFR